MFLPNFVIIRKTDGISSIVHFNHNFVISKTSEHMSQLSILPDLAFAFS